MVSWIGTKRDLPNLVRRIARTPFRRSTSRTIEGERFAEPQAGGGEQAEQRGVGLRTQPQVRREPRGFADDARDLLVAVDVWRAPSIPIRQEPARRDLGARVGGAQPGREPANIVEALAQAVTLAPVVAQRSASAVVIDVRALAVEELDEPSQIGAWPDELGAEPAPDARDRHRDCRRARSLRTSARRPGHRDITECVEVELRVDLGGVCRPMAKHLPDLGERGAPTCCGARLTRELAAG